MSKILRLVPPVEPHVPDVGDVALNVTSVAQQVTLAASLDASLPGDSDTVTAILGMWEALTGLDREQAVALAQQIDSSHTMTVAYAVAQITDDTLTPCDRSN